MKKETILNLLTKELVTTKPRKNEVTTQNITSTLITAATNLAFVNESCKSSGKVSKSQVIYRKLDGTTLKQIQTCFQQHTLKFLRLLKLFSRNRRLILSFDTTKEAFYGEFSKAEDRLYLHQGSIAKESEYYYEFLTVAITCNNGTKYIIDGRIVASGRYIEDYIYQMASYVKKYLSLELILFDRGFTSWGVIYKLKKLNVPYLIFWKDSGDWSKNEFCWMDDGEFKEIEREDKYNPGNTNYRVRSKFVLIKQLEYEDKKYDWIFATNVKLKSAEAYVKRYKKRWGIETIYRVTDDIRAYTTSTKAKIRYFLFMITCFVYNIWRCFQMFIGEDFTLANFKTNVIIYLAKRGRIYPTHYDYFEKTAQEIL
ncbi:transposase [Candidatus Woesearchaeota archaeon]|nr:transposase [Candidatus Woesearchaeota archaeon]